MSSHAITCPHCHAALRSSKPIPEHKRLRCPQCGASFANPDPPRTELTATPPPLPPSPEPEPTEGRPSGGSRVWIPALFAGVFLLGGLAVAGVYLAQPRPPAPAPAQESKAPPGEADDKRPAGADRLAEERRKLDEERHQVAEEKKRLEFSRRMHEAEDDLTKQKYAEAERAYSEALKLYPDDADAKNGLTAAKTSALAADALAVHNREEGEKRDAELARLMEQGKAAMGRKEFAAAVRAFTLARQLAPTSAEVGQALDGALAAADADAGEKKKLADYQAHLDAGRAAMTAQRFDEAAREFQAALRVLPGDATAAINLKTAQNRLAAGAEQAKRQADLADLMDQAQAALKAGRPDQAVPVLSRALKLAPDDKEIQKQLRSAKLQAAEAEAEYGRLMALGDAAMTRQRFEEANRLYTRAAQVLPGDETAATKARAALNAVTDRQAALVAYQRFMTQAGLDMENRRFASAVRNFQEALRLLPGDANALQGLADARAAVAGMNRQRTQLDSLLQQGAAALQKLQFAEAVQIFTDALQISPNDPRALRGLSQARYGRAMVQGRVALAAGRPQDAVSYFEEALREAPGDPAATALLTQARVRKK